MVRVIQLGMLPPDHPMFQQGPSLVGVKMSKPSMNPIDDSMAGAREDYEEALEQLAAAAMATPALSPLDMSRSATSSKPNEHSREEAAEQPTHGAENLAVQDQSAEVPKQDTTMEDFAKMLEHTVVPTDPMEFLGWIQGVAEEAKGSLSKVESVVSATSSQEAKKPAEKEVESDDQAQKTHVPPSTALLPRYWKPGEAEAHGQAIVEALKQGLREKGISSSESPATRAPSLQPLSATSSPHDLVGLVMRRHGVTKEEALEMLKEQGM